MNSIQFGLPIDAETLRQELPEGFEIQDTGEQYFEFDDTGFSLFVFTVTWASGISASVIASIICDAIQKRSNKPAKRILIEETHVTFDRDAITEIIRRRIEIQEEGASDEKKR